MKNKIPSVYLKTEYSMLESTIKINNLITFAKKYELKTLFICDDYNMFGVGEFIESCHRNNIKPIVGTKLKINDYDFLVFAKNNLGYQKIMLLTTRLNSQIELEVEQINDENLIIIDPQVTGYFATTKQKLNFKNYFIATNDFSNNEKNYIYIKETTTLYPKEQEAIKILQFVKSKNYDETKLNYFKDSSYEILTSNNTSALLNIQKIIDICENDFKIKGLILPQYNKDNNSFDLLKDIIKKKYQQLLEKKTIVKKDVLIYKTRIKYELEVIKQLGFCDYFLIIYDIVKWANKQDIYIGPGRGSAAGSLIAYLLEITKINPIKFNLLFERFLNLKRLSMPDIDIDIQDDRRHEIIEYIFKKYGHENTALIATFQRYGAKMAIRDVCRYYKYPTYKINLISKSLPINTNLKTALETDVKFQAFVDASEENKNIFSKALLIEGLVRQPSIHAAGIVISNKPIYEKVPCFLNHDGINQTQYSMEFLEVNKLLKIDLLGLSNLRILHTIQDEIYHNYKKKIKFDAIPNNDAKTNRILNQGLSNGIFQLEGRGMKHTLKTVQVDSIDDVAAVIALFRPGPKEFINIYAERKKNQKSYPKIDPRIDMITNYTYGILIYQEQIMEIANVMAQFSLAEADILRIAISKKKHNLIITLKKKFFLGAIKNGFNEEIIEKTFAQIESFANYGFNKSHAYAYARIAYQLAYFKAWFPFEFYTCLIRNAISSPINLKKYLKEINKLKIKWIKPNIVQSSYETINKKHQIILPLTLIKGFGKMTNKNILLERDKKPFTSFFNFVARCLNIGISESQIKSLIKANALEVFGNIKSLEQNLEHAIIYKKAIYNRKTDQLEFGLLPEPILQRFLKDDKIDIKENEKLIFGFNF